MGVDTEGTPPGFAMNIAKWSGPEHHGRVKSLLENPRKSPFIHG
jgi:hypothetical protein